MFDLLIKTNKKGRKDMFLLILSFIFLFPAKSFAIDPPGIPDGWSDGFAYANGVRIHYYHAVAAPEKPIMVMVHGVTDNGLCWTTLALELQDDYNIYMLDTRGHGLSDPFTTSDDGETLIKDVVDFVKVMNFQNPILVGHSMGAATVMRLGAEYPDLAQKIIMLDPFLARPPRREGESNRQPPPGRSDETATISDEKTVRNLSFNMFGDPEMLVNQNNYSFEDLVEKGKRDNPKWDIVDIKYWALSKKQYHGAYSREAWGVMNGTMQIGDALSNIKVPALILKVDTSRDGRKANEGAVKDLKQVKLVHIDGAAHNLHHDDLTRTTQEITEFLSAR